MIQFKNILLVVNFLIAAISFSMAQQIKSEQPVNKYRAIYWGLDQGLSQANVSAMLKDINGFLWLQTEFGLNRFDGNTFKIYLHDSKKSGTIAGDHIYGLVEDSLHNIWIGTDKGLSRYDIKADSFANFSSIVIPFWATHDEIFCTEGKSVVTYNIHSFKKQVKAKLNPTDVIGMWYDDLYNIYDPATNSVWFLRGDYKAGTNGLIQLSLFNGKEQSYYFPDIKTGE